MPGLWGGVGGGIVTGSLETQNGQRIEPELAEALQLEILY